MPEETTMRAAAEKAQRGEPMTELEKLLARAAMALMWLAERKDA